MARPRGSLQPELIQNQRKRHATYRKRKKGLKKKTSELSTLCGVQTLLICVSPTGEIDTWPDDGREVQEIVSRFQSLSPAARNKHKTELAGLLSSQISKKQKSELVRLYNEKLQQLDSKIKSVRERIQFLESKNPQDAEKKDRQGDYPTHAVIDAFSGYNYQSIPFDTTRVAMNDFSGYNYGSMPFDMARVAMDDFSGYNYKSIPFDTTRVAMDDFSGYNYKSIPFDPTRVAMNDFSGYNYGSMPFDMTRLAMDGFCGYNYQSIPFATTRVAMNDFSGYNYGASGDFAQPPVYLDPLAFVPARNSTEFHGSNLQMVMED